MMVDKRKLSKIDKIKDGMLNPGKVILTQNGLSVGDIVEYHFKQPARYKNGKPVEFNTVPWNAWHKSIHGLKGKVLNIRPAYWTPWSMWAKGNFEVCVEFFNDIGKCSNWKFGRWRHSRWLWEECLTKLKS